jgi:hypothetical protein
LCRGVSLFVVFPADSTCPHSLGVPLSKKPSVINHLADTE